MDSVEGEKGGKCLLTIHFLTSSFMIAVLREKNDSKSVIDWFEQIYEEVGIEKFKELFPLILTDNGSEFSNPLAIEFDKNGNRRTYIFYCHPSSPYEKGSCEVNHELIRRIIPKGSSLNTYTQKDINLMMSHVNSYARRKLNNKTPVLLFETLYGKDITTYLSITHISSDEITLTKSLLK